MVSEMVHSAAADAVFHALSNPTRRKVLERLTVGPATVSELAAPFDMQLPSFVQHLSVLEKAEGGGGEGHSLLRYTIGGSLT